MSNSSTSAFDALAPAVALRLNAVCEHFEEAWRGRERPQVASFLSAESDHAHRSALARELIALDVCYRRQQGETPRPDDYAALFPEAGEIWLMKLVTNAAAVQDLETSDWHPTQGRTLTLLTDDEVSRCTPMEEEAGFGSLATDKGLLPLAALEVNAQLEGLVAHIALCQTFVNPFAEPIEATYVFPLPDRMAVTHFRMEVGGRTIEGVLKERAAARQEYSQALRQGHRAAITEEERPGVFTMRVGNLMPGEEAVVQLSLVGPLPFSNGEATFRFPLLVAPRYVPGQPLRGPAVGTGASRDTDAVPDASRVTPPTLLPGFPNPVRLALAVNVHPSGIPLRDFRSSLHAVLQAEDGDGVQRIMVQAGERLNRDFILRFRVGEEAVRTSLAMLADAEGKEGTFALTLVPPAGSAQIQRRRDIVFILDRSGSMEGWKMVAARRALAHMVDTLGDQDRFTVYAFDNRIETPPKLSGTQLVDATHRNRYWAVEFLNHIEARDGTELYQPLDLAAHVLCGGESKRERILVLVTDGQVANENQILRGLGERARQFRIFALGIDQAVNEGFLRQLVGLGNGSYELVESEERLQEVTEQIHRAIANPVLTGLRLESDGFEIHSECLVPRRLPDLFSGAALMVWGRFRGAPQGSLVVRARDAEGRPWFATVPARRSHNPAISPLWARGRVRELEDEFAMARSGRDTIERQIVATSLRFGVLCRFTSFVAVDRAAVVNPGGEVKAITQAVEMPQGWAAATAIPDDELAHSATLMPKTSAVPGRASSMRTGEANATRAWGPGKGALPHPGPGLPPSVARPATTERQDVEGSYKKINKIGSGSFGEVWRAEAPGGIAVALKIISRPLNPDEAQRDFQPLELIKRLRHPCLTQMYAYWFLADKLCIVTELADCSLRDRFKQCQKEGLPGIPVQELVGYFHEAAEALDYLHNCNVLHRDIKPDNLLLFQSEEPRREGKVSAKRPHLKLGDLGQRQGLGTSTAGTPAYMPPEAWNDQVSRHGDQYSLAVTFAELRLGHAVFAGKNMYELMVECLTREPDLSGMEDREQQVLRKALAKDPNERFANCLEFVHELSKAVILTPPPMHTPSGTEGANMATLRPRNLGGMDGSGSRPRRRLGTEIEVGGSTVTAIPRRFWWFLLIMGFAGILWYLWSLFF